MSVKENISTQTGAPNGEAPDDGALSDEDNNDEIDNMECTCYQNKDSNDNKDNNDAKDNDVNKDNNDKKDNEDNKNKRLKVQRIPVNPLLTPDYTLCDEYIPATAETPGFLRYKDVWLEEVPTIVINKTTGETYRTCEPYKNCKTGIITVHNEYDDPTDRPPRRPTNSVAPPKKKKVVKKQTRNPFKKFKRM